MENYHFNRWWHVSWQQLARTSQLAHNHSITAGVACGQCKRYAQRDVGSASSFGQRQRRQRYQRQKLARVNVLLEQSVSSTMHYNSLCLPHKYMSKKLSQVADSSCSRVAGWVGANIFVTLL